MYVIYRNWLRTKKWAYKFTDMNRLSLKKSIVIRTGIWDLIIAASEQFLRGRYLLGILIKNDNFVKCFHDGQELPTFSVLSTEIGTNPFL